MEVLIALEHLKLHKAVTLNAVYKIVLCHHGLLGLHSHVELETEQDLLQFPDKLHAEELIVSLNLHHLLNQTSPVLPLDVPGPKTLLHVPQETVLDTTTPTTENVTVPKKEMMDTL